MDAKMNEQTTSTEPLISVKDLHVRFSTPKGPVHAVRGVSFDLRRERLGIVGESGSGKSQTGRALLRLTAGNGKIEASEMMFDGINLMEASEKTMRNIRGSRISMIMQDPKYSLNPVMTVGAQIAESCREHEDVSKAEAKRRALSMLEAVRIREPEKVFNLYPHQVSGGMGQRIMIAMMLITDPEVMIADEPTSALDVTVQMQVLALLDDMVRERGMGLVLISHDLHLVSSFCDRVLVMYGGRIMEILDAKHLDKAQHPYTKGLLSCLPRMDGQHDDLPVLHRDPAWMTEELGGGIDT